MNFLPFSKPKAPRDLVIAAASKQWKIDRPAEPLPTTFLCFIRGYYRDTMGKVGANDRGIYDDAAFVVGPETFASFNANSDPSAFRSGVATLLPGCYPYKKGNHGISRPGGGYPAFRPATPGEALPVRRDGESAVPSKTPGVAINIHRGSYTSTSSLGCQTLHPSQWDAFYNLAAAEMSKASLKMVWVIVLDGPIN